MQSPPVLRDRRQHHLPVAPQLHRRILQSTAVLRHRRQHHLLVSLQRRVGKLPSSAVLLLNWKQSFLFCPYWSPAFL